LTASVSPIVKLKTVAIIGAGVVGLGIGGNDFMRWFAPSEKNADPAALEKRLWDAADQFHANSGVKSYCAPVLGLIFLGFAKSQFAARCPLRALRGTEIRLPREREQAPSLPIGAAW
jgi:hypothetical protein